MVCSTCGGSGHNRTTCLGRLQQDIDNYNDEIEAAQKVIRHAKFQIAELESKKDRLAAKEEKQKEKQKQKESWKVFAQEIKDYSKKMLETDEDEPTWRRLWKMQHK